MNAYISFLYHNAKFALSNGCMSCSLHNVGYAHTTEAP